MKKKVMLMLPLLLAVVIVVVSFGTVYAQSGSEAVFTGKISGLKEPVELRVHYFNAADRSFLYDTIAVQAEGQFRYSTMLDHIVRLNVSGGASETGLPPRGFSFIFSPGSRLTMDADVSDPQSFLVTGDEQNRVFQEFQQKKQDVVKEDMHEFLLAYIKANPDNFGLLNELMGSTLDYEDKPEMLKELYEHTSPELKANPFAHILDLQINALINTQPGATAPDFTRLNMQGEVVSLSDFRGKYVVLDFWGSWCGPCRASHPKLIELYAKYADEGFEIVSIAKENEANLEAAKEKWLGAIAEDGVDMWTHVLNNDEYDGRDIILNYSIVGYPTKILLDKEGKVVGNRYLGMREEVTIELIEKLEEIFGH